MFNVQCSEFGESARLNTQNMRYMYSQADMKFHSLITIDDRPSCVAAGGGGGLSVLDASERDVQLPCLAAVRGGGTYNLGKRMSWSEI